MYSTALPRTKPDCGTSKLDKIVTAGRGSTTNILSSFPRIANPGSLLVG